jgi:circadian clock protein KaiC
MHLELIETMRTLTGIDGLDTMLNGGIPKGRVVLVCGGPGTGKTTLALQFLVNGYTKYGEKGIFVSLDEPLWKLFEEAKSYGWDLQKLQKEGGVSFIFEGNQGNPRTFVDSIINSIKKEIHNIDAQRISIDALTYLTILYPDIIARRSMVRKLFDALAETSATCLVTDEVRMDGGRLILLEEYLADGVILLQTSQVERSQVRTIEIEKMRGTPVDDQIRPYIIEDKGIRVLSETDILTFAASFLMKKGR